MDKGVGKLRAAQSAPPRLLLRPEGRNRRGETRLRGPEVLGPIEGVPTLGFLPSRHR